MLPSNDELISAYIDDALSDADRRQFEIRLTADPALQRLVAELRATRAMLRSAPVVLPPRDFRIDAASLPLRVVARRAPRLTVLRIISAAAAILLLGIGIFSLVQTAGRPSNGAAVPNGVALLATGTPAPASLNTDAGQNSVTVIAPGARTIAPDRNGPTALMPTAPPGATPTGPTTAKLPGSTGPAAGAPELQSSPSPMPTLAAARAAATQAPINTFLASPEPPAQKGDPEPPNAGGISGGAVTPRINEPGPSAPPPTPSSATSAPAPSINAQAVSPTVSSAGASDQAAGTDALAPSWISLLWALVIYLIVTFSTTRR